MNRLLSACVVSLVFAGCSGRDALVRVTQVDWGEACAYGGVKVESGRDLDGNGVLTADEVGDSAYVCNQRVDGKTSLVDVRAEGPGLNCENGGQRITFGLDDNQDFVLQDAEVDSTRYVCNGRNRLLSLREVAPGAEGCEQGGVEVLAGYDLNGNGRFDDAEAEVRHVVCHGRAHLLRVEEVDESNPGAACPAGGLRVQSGFDANGNGALDDVEVQRTEFVCHGEDGKSTLVKLSPLSADPAGACLFGGTRLESGLDLDGDGALAPAEVQSTRDVCAVQVNAFMTLVKNSVVLPGAQCAFGGVKTEVGIDDNDNRALEPEEVDSSTTHCNTVMVVDGLTTLVDTVPASPAQCAFGGLVLRSGLDDNRNGALDPAEFDAVEVLCNGANGYDGVTRTAPYQGPQCGSGAGFRVESGLDLNRNGALDTAEVRTTAYVCHGADGSNGTAGAAGANSLIRTTDGAQVCGAYGGLKVESGVDANRNGVLDSAEVSNTGYVCNGWDGYTSLVAMFDAAGACGPYGGIRVEVGLDLDGDLYLDVNEVTQYAYVCHGWDGYSAAVESAEGYWSACGGGWGVRLLSGLDLDFDGYLDPNEVQYENYLCE